MKGLINVGSIGSGRRGAAQDEACAEALSANLAVLSDPEYRRLATASHDAGVRRRMLGLGVPDEAMDPEMYAKQQAADMVHSDAFKVMIAREKYIREQHQRAWKHLTRKELASLVKSAEKS